MAALTAVVAGGIVAVTYHMFETLEPQDDVWFAGLIAGFGLVTVPIIIDLVAIDVIGRLLRQDRRLALARSVTVVAGGLIGVVLVAAVSARAAEDPFIGFAFVVLPQLVFALGVVVLILLVIGALIDRKRSTLAP